MEKQTKHKNKTKKKGGSWKWTRSTKPLKVNELPHVEEIRASCDGSTYGEWYDDNMRPSMKPFPSNNDNGSSSSCRRRSSSYSSGRSRSAYGRSRGSNYRRG